MPDSQPRQSGVDGEVGVGLRPVRARWWWVGGAVAVLAVGLTVFLALGRVGSAAVAPIPLGAAEQERLESGLAADALADQAAVLAAEIRPAFVAAGRPLFATDVDVRLDPGTFASSEVGLAQVEAQVDGGGRWQLLLSREGERWQVYATRALP